MTSHKQLFIKDVQVELHRKRVKNINLRVTSPDGVVRVSAPKRVSEKIICEFIHEKLDWIRSLQHEIRTRTHATPTDFNEHESVFIWGEEHPLKLQISPRPHCALIDRTFIISTPKHYSPEQKEALYHNYLRKELTIHIPQLINTWQKRINVKAEFWGIKKMKTKWGSCNTQRARIWLNLELAKYTFECLEYVLVHELVHLLERNHNARFYGFMDHYLPSWKTHEKILNKKGIT